MGDGEMAREEARRAALALSVAGCATAIFALVLCYTTGLPWRVWLGVCVIHAACFAHGWLTPALSRRDALAIVCILVLIALLAIGVTAEAQATMGRTFAPFNGNKIVALLIAIFCPSLTIGMLLLAACVVGPLVQTALWAPEVRALIPQLEPVQTFVVVSVASMFLYVRRRHAERVQELAHIQAETEGLERVAAVGLRVHEGVEQLVADLRRALVVLRREADADAVVRRMDRVTYRLHRLSETLTPLRRIAAQVEPEPAAALEARRAAIAVASLVSFGSALVVAVAASRHGFSVAPGMLGFATGATALVVALALPRLRVRTYHLLFALAGLGAITMVLLNNDAMIRRGHIDAFPGIKLAMLACAFLAPSGRLGVLLIGLGTLAPVVETYAWWSPEQRAHMAMLEPWSTVLFGLVSLLLLIAQRRRTALLRTLATARADRDGLTRTARIVLALRDLVNSPLQTLIMSIELAYGRVGSAQLDAIAAAIARLREQLQTLPVFELEDALVFDAFDDLEREVTRVTANARLTTLARP